MGIGYLDSVSAQVASYKSVPGDKHIVKSLWEKCKRSGCQSKFPLHSTPVHPNPE